MLRHRGWLVPAWPRRRSGGSVPGTGFGSLGAFDNSALGRATGLAPFLFLRTALRFGGPSRSRQRGSGQRKAGQTTCESQEDAEACVGGSRRGRFFHGLAFLSWSWSAEFGFCVCPALNHPGDSAFKARFGPSDIEKRLVTQQLS